MILIAIAATLLSISWLLNLPLNLTEFSSDLHNFCLQNLPNSVENVSSLEALVCGKNMQTSEIKELLVHTSLIHVFVVSGSHFLFLHKVFAKLFKQRYLSLAPLCLYALITQCQPPAVRSLFFLSITEITREKKLFTPPLVAVFLSGLLSLCLFPDWIYSRSLLMSLAASLALTITSELLHQETEVCTRAIFTQIFLYISMTFCLWGASNLHPLGMVLNLTLGPLIGVVLFPLGIIVTLIPPLTPLFDGTINLLFWILMATNELFKLQTSATSLPLYLLWLIFLGALTLAHIFSIQKKRARYES